MPKTIYMDLTRCIYCRACEVACQREHGGQSNMFVQLSDDGHAVPINCRHCETSFCTEVCPTGAVYHASEGLVMVAPMKCIGCGLCTLACPFGSIWFDALNRVARKCDLCIHRTQAGLEPACVASCSSRALAFGELDGIVDKARRKRQTVVISRAAGYHGTVVALPSNWNGKRPQKP